MLLTITTTHHPASDLGYLLHKNPARPQVFNLSFGKAHVFYSEASEERCTAAMLLEVDPVGLVRNRRGPAGEGFALEQYVNDRPYVASSFMSVAIAQVLGSGLSGVSRERPQLAQTPIPLIARLSALPCRGGDGLLHRLFEPLGYQIEAIRQPLDERFAEWGDSPYYGVTLRKTTTLSELLTHLYVLIPVLDNEKHYWIGEDEVEKLLRHGQHWLSSHPEKEQIVSRYLKHRRALARQALAQLLEEDQAESEEAEERHAIEEEQVEERISLNDQRLDAVFAALNASGARRVLDLGCSYGNLLRRLAAERQFAEIVGLDVSHRALEIAAERLRLDRLPEHQRKRLRLIQGSLNYRDRRIAGYDAAAVVEVIEHLDAPRLAAFERVLFEFARPATVVLTTPNVEYNVRFPTLPAGRFRHKDHRFEWTRQQFRSWATGVSDRFGYSVEFAPIGPDDPELGSPTQMAVFHLISNASVPPGGPEREGSVDPQNS